jgi:hypothetical protein
VRHSRRFHLVLGAELDSGLRTFAAARGISLAEALRTLAFYSLVRETGAPISPDRESAGTLAALVAAEHATLMVAAVLPDGRRLLSQLAPEAAAAAEERLAMFREAER